MKEADVIKQTKTPLTKDDLKTFFTRIGIKKDDTLVVHASLSKLGFVIGGAQSVIEALLETLSEGTIVMPAHSGDLSNPADYENPPVPKTWIKTMKTHMPAFNPETTPLRGMGKIASQFMVLKDTLRSNHPQVSFCAHGVHAEMIIKDHPLTPMFDMESPLGKVYRLDGKILMLGAPLSTCSAFHLSEVLSGAVGMSQEESPIIKEGQRQWVKFEDLDYDADDFAQIGNKLKEDHIIKSYSLSIGEAHIMDAQAAIDRATEIIRQTRNS